METTKYGSWVKGQATIRQMLEHMLTSYPPSVLDSMPLYGTLTLARKPPSTNTEYDKEGFTAMSIRYGDDYKDFR